MAQTLQFHFLSDNSLGVRTFLVPGSCDVICSRSSARFTWVTWSPLRRRKIFASSSPKVERLHRYVIRLQQLCLLIFSFQQYARVPISFRNRYIRVCIQLSTVDGKKGGVSSFWLSDAFDVRNFHRRRGSRALPLFRVLRACTYRPSLARTALVPRRVLLGTYSSVLRRATLLASRLVLNVQAVYSIPFSLCLWSS